MANEIKIGDVIEGTVVRVYPKYAILLFDSGETGLLHISEASSSYIRDFTAFIQVGSIYKVKVIERNVAGGYMKVSIKRLTNQERHGPLGHSPVDPQRISFAELEKRLPEWTIEESERKE